MKSKGTQTKIRHTQIAEERPSSTSLPKSSSKSLWSRFSNDWLPTNILGTNAVGIQKDLREGTTQISEL